MDAPFDRGEIDRSSIEATERLRARLSGRPPAAAPQRRANVLPWVVAGGLFVFTAGMIANPWFETRVRSGLPSAAPAAAPATNSVDVAALQGRIAQMLLGAIVDDPGDAIGPPFDIDPLAHHPDAAALAIAAADAGFEGEGLAVRYGLLERFADHCLILGLVERHRLFDADRAPGFEPGDGIDLVRPVEPLRGEIDPP
jgi:hypothetical protein